MAFLLSPLSHKFRSASVPTTLVSEQLITGVPLFRFSKDNIYSLEHLSATDSTQMDLKGVCVGNEDYFSSLPTPRVGLQLVDSLDCDYKWSSGDAQHRGSVRTSYPAAPGSNITAPEDQLQFAAQVLLEARYSCTNQFKIGRC